VENNLQKPIISPLFEEVYSTLSLQQDNLKTDDGPGIIKDPLHNHQLKETHASQDSTTELCYTIPTANRFAVLSNEKDYSNNDHFQTLGKGDTSHRIYNRDQNLQHGTQKRNEPLKSTSHQKLHYIQPQEVFSVPTIVNGSVNIPSARRNKLLQTTTKATNKIVLIGDSHIKGLAAALTTVLPSKFEIFSIVKPGANTKSISASIQETVNQLTQDDVIVLSSGTNGNDNDQDYYKSTFVNIKEYLFSLTHTNVLVLGIPFRYDLQNSREVNSIITKINMKISKLVHLLPNARFLPSNNDGKLFINHGLHRNKFGKQLLVTQLLSLTLNL
jgi:hypothetical protein